MRAFLLPWALAAVALTCAACDPFSRTTPGPGVTVVATTTQLQDLVANVGGPRVHLVGILKPNVDPHEYEPRPSDATALTDARLIVESGLGLDGWMGGLLSAAGAGTPTWAASTGLPVRRAGRDRSTPDPHWWHDPRNVEKAALALAAELGRVDPAGAATYRANAAAYVVRVERMDAANLADLGRIPVAERRLVTSHDAFGYLAARYRITIVGSVLDSLSATAQPSARKIAELVARIRAERVRAIFTESSINPKLEREIAREAGVRVDATLYGDTLGPVGSPGATYLGMERWNVRAIVAGLLARPEPRS